MKHLSHMCCESCREQLAEIEARADTQPFSVHEVEQAHAERRVLLQMVESLLFGVAVNRRSWAELAKLLPHLLPPAQAPE